MTIAPASLSNDDDSLIDDKIAAAVEGIEERASDIDSNNNKHSTNYNHHYVTARLKQLQSESIENTITVCDYIISLTNESNPVPHYKQTQIQLLCYLSSHLYDKKEKKQKKLFSEMTRDDVLSYLNKGRKSESEDPTHKWIGTYNLRRTNLIRFFKWLYYPDILPSTNRPIPDVVKNIPKLKRKEISTVLPAHLWSDEDDHIFLKYCPSPRDRCYHAVSRDTSARPSELLNLRLKDINFEVTTDGTNSQFARAIIRGKTGQRDVAIINALPYVKEWINIHHPQRNNPNAFFIPTLDKRYRRFGYRLSSMSLYHIYKNYQLKFFPKLLEDKQLPEEDRQKIQKLLQKPWNPYIRRHTALTEKAQMLPDNALKQHSGWSGGSQMHLKYVHFFPQVSSNILLEAHGITPPNKDGNGKDKLNLTNKKLSTPRQCPNCFEPNTVDSKFCVKCKQVLSYETFMHILEDRQKNENQLKELERKMNAQQLVQKVQQGLLGIIATAIQVNQEGILNDDNIVRLFKKGDPQYTKYNRHFNNTPELKEMPDKEKIQRLREIKEERQQVIQNVILPAVSDISKYAFNEPLKAKEIVRKVLDDQSFKMFFWQDDAVTTNNNDTNNNKDSSSNIIPE